MGSGGLARKLELPMSGSFGLMGVAFQYQELKSFQADGQ